MTLPTPSLKSPEEVAKELLDVYYRSGAWEQIGIGFQDVIQADRSRLVAYLREKVPKKRRFHWVKESEDVIGMKTRTGDFGGGWNSALEAVEKILGDI